MRTNAARSPVSIAEAGDDTSLSKGVGFKNLGYLLREAGVLARLYSLGAQTVHVVVGDFYNH